MPKKRSRRKSPKRRSHRRRSRSRSRSRSRAGKIRRVAYKRKAYTRKDGTRVKATVVPATYIKDVGRPGKGPKLIGPLKKGKLGKYGYSLDKSAKARHTALARAVKAYGANDVVWKLNAVRVLNRRRPSIYKKFNADMRWVQKKYKTGQRSRSRSRRRRSRSRSRKRRSKRKRNRRHRSRSRKRNRSRSRRRK